MKISILCSSQEHPIYNILNGWMNSIKSTEHEIELVRRKSDLSGGDLLFLISCSEILNQKDRSIYKKVLVIHASDLPRGRGWSPHIWQILEGQTEIVVSLLEASDRVDSGDIWHQVKIDIPKSALYDEINNILFDAEIELMNFAVSNFDVVSPCIQRTDIESSYYSKRSPEDSKLDVNLSIADQFNLMRVCDPKRFPAFFKLYGCKYKILLEKVSDE